MLKKSYFLIGLILLLGFVSASPNLWYHANFLSGNPGQTLGYEFNITLNGDCTSVIYTNKTTLTSDSSGVVDYYLGNINQTAAKSQLNLCIYESGILIENVSLALSPQTGYALNVSGQGILDDSNISIQTHDILANQVRAKFFNWTIAPGISSSYLIFTGSILSFSESFLNSTINNLISLGSSNSSNFWDNLDTPADLENKVLVNCRNITGNSSDTCVDDNSNIFNQILNTTSNVNFNNVTVTDAFITTADRICNSTDCYPLQDFLTDTSGTGKSGDSPYLFNNSNTLFFNDTFANDTYDSKYLPIDTAIGDFYGRNYTDAFDDNFSTKNVGNFYGVNFSSAFNDNISSYGFGDFYGRNFSSAFNDNITDVNNLTLATFRLSNGSRYVNLTPSDYQTEDYLLYTPPNMGGKGSLLYVNGSGFLNWTPAMVENQSLLFWNDDSGWREVLNGCTLFTPSSNCRLVKNSTEVFWTSAGVSPTLSDVLTNGDRTNAGQKIAFGQNNVNLTSLTAGQLDIGAKNIEFHANFSFTGSQFNYLVCDDCFAFVSESDRDAGLKFESAGTQSRFILTDLAGGEGVNVSVFGANSGTVSIKDTAIIGDKLVVGTFAPTPNASFGAGDVWAAGGFFGAFFATHSPKLDCLEKESGGYGFYCLVTFIKSSRNNEFTEARVKVTVDENFTILWSNESLNQEVLSHFAFIEDNQKVSKEFENARRECEEQPFHQFVTQGEYRQGSRECFFVQSMADSSCRENGRFYRYDQGTGQCVRDERLFCEQFPWQRWNQRSGQCETNEISECLINGVSRNQTWDFNQELCVESPEVECSNRGMGWEWNGRSCEFSERLAAYECIQENPQCNEWRERACVDRCRP